MKTHTCPRTYRSLLAAAVLAAAWLLPTCTSRANNPVVTTTADSGPGSLRNAVATTTDNGTITFGPGAMGTITLTSEIPIGGNLTISGPGGNGVTISGNSSSRAFNIAAGATVTISYLTITDGRHYGANGTGSDGAPGQGGAIFNAGNLTLADCWFTYNDAYGGDVTGDGAVGGDGQGGGVYSEGTLTLVDCFFWENYASGGNGSDDNETGGNGTGGAVFSQGALAMTNCTLWQNYTFGGSVTSVNNAFGGNGFGGGISVIQTGELVNCTIVANSAIGGGVSTLSQGATAGNGQGGGVFVTNRASTGPSTTVVLTSCTICGNVCDGGLLPSLGYDGSALGGGIYAAAPPTLNNTIVSGNSVVVSDIFSTFPAGTATGPDVYGGVTSGGFNLIGADDGSLGWLVGTRGADMLGTASEVLNPLLGPLQNNGGATPTMALAATSRAVDKGYSFGLTSDQRGSPRPVEYVGSPPPTGGDWSDIGAFELKRPFINLDHNAFVFSDINGVLTFLKLTWNETDFFTGTNTAGTGHGIVTFNPFGITPSINTTQPMFGVQVSPDPTFHQALTSAMPVWMRNGVYELRDTMAPPGAFYRLSTAVTNLFLLPAVTTAATAISSNAATLNGTTTPYGLDTAYWFEYGADTNYGTCTPTNDLASSTNLASLSYAIGGLTPSTAVHFQLVVTDDDGIQLGGDQTFMTLSNAPAAPTPTVVSYAATSVGYTNVTLNGSVNGNGLPVGAWFEYGLDTSYGSSTYNNQFFTSSDYFAAQAYSAPITGLTPNTTYHYRAIASSLNGQGVGADQTFTTATETTQPLPTVSTLAASSVTESSAVLNGSANPNGGASTAFFEWGTDTSYGNITIQTGIGTTPQSDFQASLTGLSPYTTYHYRIDANNSGGITYGADTNFTTAWAPVPPTLVSPGTSTAGSPGLATTTPTFTWTGASPATSFDLVILGYPSGNQISVTSVGGTAYTLPNGILANGAEYEWYMVSFNSLGDESSQSSPLFFTTAAAPTVVTLPETNVVGAVYARLAGSVNPNNASTTAYFEYGTTTGYGTITTQTGIGTTAQIFITTVNGLTAGVTYHYRIDAVNGVASSYGSDVTFVAP